MPRKFNERILVEYISEFFIDNFNNQKFSDLATARALEEDMRARISNFVKNKNLNPEQAITLERALWIQHYAGLYVQNKDKVHYVNSGYGGSFIYLPYPYYGWGGCCGYHHHHHHHHGVGGSGSSNNVDGEAGLVLLCICMAAAAVAAAVGMAFDLAHTGEELSYKQRLAPNIATLSLTAAYTVGAVLICIPLFAANPLIGAIAAFAFVIGMALLVKGSRSVGNLAEGYLDTKSGAWGDSRFQLTIKEELQIRKQLEDEGMKPAHIDDRIEKIKGIIRTLALQSNKTTEMAFFGSNKKYLNIIEVLNEVKKGNINDRLKAQYKFDEFPDPDPSASNASGV